MLTARAISDVLAGTDVKIRRQIAYWGATLIVYSMCVALLWFEVRSGDAAAEPARWLTGFFLAGIVVFYALIRASKHLRLQPAQLAAYQGYFAIICIVADYAILGAMLSINDN